MTTEEMMFFNSKPQSLELYEELSGKILKRFPGTEVQVHKSQITFKARYGYAFVSLRKIKGSPPVFITLSFGLGYRLDSERIAIAVEPYPQRWTHHVIIADKSQIDEELMSWLKQAYEFALAK